MGVVIGIAVLAVVLGAAGYIAYRKTRSPEKKAIKTVADAMKDCDGHVYTDYKVVIDGDKHSVDLVFLGAAGLIVAKVITEKGKIFGDNMSKEWLRIEGKDEKHFESPVKDKERQVNVLRAVVPADYQIFSFVVFMNADIKEVRCANVLTFDGLKQYIKDQPKALSKNKIDDIKKLLDDYKKSSK